MNAPLFLPHGFGNQCHGLTDGSQPVQQGLHSARVLSAQINPPRPFLQLQLGRDNPSLCQIRGRKSCRVYLCHNDRQCSLITGTLLRCSPTPLLLLFPAPISVSPAKACSCVSQIAPCPRPHLRSCNVSLAVGRVGCRVAGLQDEPAKGHR